MLPHRRQAQHGRHQGQVRPVKGCPDHGGPGSLSTPPPPRDNSGSGLLPRLDKAHVSTQTARYKLAEALLPPNSSRCSGGTVGRRQEPRPEVLDRHHKSTRRRKCGGKACTHDAFCPPSPPPCACVDVFRVVARVTPSIDRCRGIREPVLATNFVVAPHFLGEEPSATYNRGEERQGRRKAGDEREKGPGKNGDVTCSAGDAAGGCTPRRALGAIFGGSSGSDAPCRRPCEVRWCVPLRLRFSLLC